MLILNKRFIVLFLYLTMLSGAFQTSKASWSTGGGSGNDTTDSSDK